MRAERDWEYDADKVAHYFPSLAASVGGDPLDLPCETILHKLENLADIERWKQGGKEQERRDRRFMEWLERVT